MIYFNKLKSTVNGYLQPSTPAQATTTASNAQSTTSASSYIPSVNINAVELFGAGAAGYLLAGLSHRLRQNSAPTNQEVLLTFGAIGLYVGFKATVKAGQALRSLVTPIAAPAPANATSTKPGPVADKSKNKKPTKTVASEKETTEVSEKKDDKDDKASLSEAVERKDKKKSTHKSRQQNTTAKNTPLKSKGTKEEQRNRRKRKSV